MEAAAIAGIGASLIGGVTGAYGAQITAAGNALQIQGAMQQTIAQAFGLQVQAQQYDYSAKVADYNAAIQDINYKVAVANANYELDVAGRKAEQSGMQTRYNLGMAVASQGASGIALDSKTSAGVRASIVELGEYDQATIRADGARKAYAYDVEATQALAQADLYRYTSAVNTMQSKEATTAAGMTMAALPLEEEAKSLAGTAGTLGMISSLAGGSASVATKWMSPNNPLVS